MRDVRGRVAVVTGAASGIGRGLAERFAGEGMRVVLADVEEAPLQAAADELRAGGAEVLAVRTDVSQAEQVDALAAAAYDGFGAVHVLCNNAGIGGGGGASWELPLEDWQWTLGVNLWGVIHGVRSFVPRMIAGGEEGHIVNTASVAGLIAGAGGPAYTVTKFGVVGLTETLHHELLFATTGRIRASVLCPALTNTRILESGRNRPGGPLPEPAAGTPERIFLDMLKGVFATGMAPSETALMVLEGIREQRFYILTHPEHNPALTRRAEAIIAGGDPPVLQPG